MKTRPIVYVKPLNKLNDKLDSNCKKTEQAERQRDVALATAERLAVELNIKDALKTSASKTGFGFSQGNQEAAINGKMHVAFPQEALVQVPTEAYLS